MGVSALALLVVPRRWAALPLLAGACYMTLGQGIDVGPLTFTVVRILVLVGLVRVIIRGERLAGGSNQLDYLIMAWGVWVCATSPLHHDPETGFVFRLGLVYNAAGLYFLLRVFCSSTEDIVRVCQLTALLLVPVAAEMVYEHVASHNMFSILGGVSPSPLVREGNIRATGPFSHPILAGTVGAVSLPLVVGIWRYHRLSALLGIGACCTIVLASRSSGPIMSAIFALVALLMWSCRHNMRAIRWSLVLLYLVLSLVMKAPPYYLIARIDIAGGSTGFYRARLIESSLEHLSEWWLYGTDYTRHWMVTGVAWNPNHVDITNHYLQMGVWGGLPLTILFILTVAKGFSYVGVVTHIDGNAPAPERFLVWSLGASLFAHAATFISVSYFDQSVFFIYLTFAVVAATRRVPSLAPVAARTEVAKTIDRPVTTWVPPSGRRVAGSPAVPGAAGRPAPRFRG
jgi:hypothetical protein